MAELSDFKFTKRQWAEIAAFAALAAAAAYVLSRKSAGNPASADVSHQNFPAVVPQTATVGPFSPTGIGLPPLNLPGTPGSSGSCGCGCAAGSSDPTIGMITHNTNAALAAMQSAENSTLQYIANIGNATNPGLVDFVTSPVS